jgi:hypothetical protein
MRFCEVLFFPQEICAKYQSESKSILGKISRGEKNLPKDPNKKEAGIPDARLQDPFLWDLQITKNLITIILSAEKLCNYIRLCRE